MFIGHYAVGFALKKRTEAVPLWLLFLSVQAVDILAFSLVLLGVEKIAYNPSPNPFLRTVVEFTPYSHSLFSNLIMAAIALGVFWKLKGKSWGVTLSIGFLSHWFLDTLVHLPDLPLIYGDPKVGFGLWQLPWVVFSLEQAAFILFGLYLLRGRARKGRLVILLLFLSLGFSGMFFAPEAEASPAEASVFSLLMYATATGMAYWIERGEKIAAEE